jgi:inosose dehydratase
MFASPHLLDFSHTPQTRRHFLRQGIILGATALAGASGTDGRSAENPGSPVSETLVGSNVYGWGQYAQRDHKNLDMDEVLSALRDAGYDYLESFLDVAHPDENGRFAEKLKAKGLRPVSLYTGARLHEAEKLDEVLGSVVAATKVAQLAGFSVLSCNADPIGREKTDEELKTQVKGLTRLGTELNRLGMKLAVHQHLPEMANHGREFHYDFDNSQPELVGWCYDVHWVWKGGVMPLDALRQYGNRVVTWHLRQSRQGIWWEVLDDGDVDYGAVAQYAREHHLPRRFSVELAIEPGTKITKSVFENHRRSREFVHKVFGA